MANRNPALFSDGENYVEYLEQVLAGEFVNAEPSFQFITDLVGEFGISGVFFVYLVLGFLLKGMYFLLRMPGHSHLFLIYLTSYFVIHDLVQIRVGAALGLALWAVHHLGERNILIATLLWLSSFMLHYSVIPLAILSFLIFAVENRKIQFLSIVRIGYVLFIISSIFFLMDYSFIDILSNLLNHNKIIPERYVNNYLEAGEFIGVLKIFYAFALAVIAIYALHQGLLLTFVARHAAFCLIVAYFVLIIFRDMPVIGARMADTLLFFSPLMVYGLFVRRPKLSRIVFFSMLIIQVVNLTFFSTVILF